MRTNIVWRAHQDIYNTRCWQTFALVAIAVIPELRAPSAIIDAYHASADAQVSVYIGAEACADAVVPRRVRAATAEAFRGTQRISERPARMYGR